MRVAALMANGFEETEAITTIDILRRAGITVDVVSISDDIVTSSHGIKLVSDKLFNNMNGYDALFLPGGQPGTNNLKTDARVISLLQDYASQNKLIGAICAAPLVLEEAGLLNQKAITSYPMGDSKALFPDAHYSEELVVKDGKILTSRGVGTALNFALAFVEALGLDASDMAKSVLFQGKLK